jgi:hypothetical protein
MLLGGSGAFQMNFELERKSQKLKIIYPAIFKNYQF